MSDINTNGAGAEAACENNRKEKYAPNNPYNIWTSADKKEFFIFHDKYLDGKREWARGGTEKHVPLWLGIAGIKKEMQAEALEGIKERFSIDEVKESGPVEGVVLENGKRVLVMKKEVKSDPVSPLGTDWEPRSITDWACMDIDESATLLGNRWLCRHGLACFVASSGQGKSVASIQCGILWGAGREAFGIKPAKPLKVLVIQGEDDEGDVIEMSRMLGALDLSEEELERTEMNTLVGRKNVTGKAFNEFLEAAVADFKPDLVILNPLNNYIGSDDKDANAWIVLRGVFYSLMKKYDFGMLLFHHTPKTNFQSTSSFSSQDWQYRGAGTAGITNSIRACILMEPVGKEHPGVYRFIGSKRGSRCGGGWQRGESGLPERFFKHCEVPGLMFWEDAEPVVKETKKNVNMEKLMKAIFDLVPKHTAVGKTALEVEIQRVLGVGRDKARECLKAMYEDGAIYSWKIQKEAGQGGRPIEGWSQHEQVEEAPRSTKNAKK